VELLDGLSLGTLCYITRPYVISGRVVLENSRSSPQLPLRLPLCLCNGHGALALEFLQLGFAVEVGDALLFEVENLSDGGNIALR